MAETGKKPGRTATQAKPRKTTSKKNATPKAEAAPQNHHRSISHEEVAQLAHQYWIERGRTHGSHEEDWLRAEQDLLARAS